mmetsp:Transcript_14749/g.17826  ORF Transcript_14749/g.17826 Transcript_14749/m.17826 type:complete len:223 (+) Transcript_14749:125-793(+)|eukprot:CAMPEP_0197845078 /NCGR_PEP_ID=MMETSP1438-20131217/2026_1 /TAXON_ID=1461541 /ORGANISM="Pterosperma sp., Strain CCMP1384" /LENGTH=222 /DNA_ID=CAMNT_0043456179 /DNA_START=123 /DNA_END=794 /DNA_ORIENTATION=+
MNRSSALIFILGLCATVSAYSEDSRVVILTDDNFEHDTQAATGQTSGIWFVKFWAPWCGHCKRLAPLWDELAEELLEEGIILAQLDITQHPVTYSRFSDEAVKGFPTLLLFAERKMFKFKGARDKENLLAFARGEYRKVPEEQIMEVPAEVTAFQKMLAQAGNIPVWFNNKVVGLKDDWDKYTEDSPPLRYAGYGGVFFLLTALACWPLLIGAPTQPPSKRD